MIEVSQIQRGDVLVITMPTGIQSQEQFDTTKRLLEGKLPGVSVLLKPHDVKVEIWRLPAPPSA